MTLHLRFVHVYCARCKFCFVSRSCPDAVARKSGAQFGFHAGCKSRAVCFTNWLRSDLAPLTELGVASVHFAVCARTCREALVWCSALCVGWDTMGVFCRVRSVVVYSCKVALEIGSSSLPLCRSFACCEFHAMLSGNVRRACCSTP